MKRSGIVTLLTDFGEMDGYVAAMKGAMLCLAPHLQLVDVSHQIVPQDITEAAFVLASSYALFPKGTVHLVVVDPGVGSARRAIAVQSAGHLFVAPDNGVLTSALGDAARAAVSLTNAAYWRTREVSTTFHGRDIFASVAAHLAAGTTLEQVGEPVQDMVMLPWPKPQLLRDGALQGIVIHVDRFGNLITNMAEDVVLSYASASIQVGAHTISGIQTTYASVPVGGLLALIGSHGMLEVAARDGNAADTLGLGKGAVVTLR